MTDAIDTPARTTPWHLWAVGVISLLWNAMGAMDYVMKQLQVEGYMNNIPEQVRDFIAAYPAWMNACWAIGVWGAVAGSVLLLLRLKWAVWAFGASLVALIISTIYVYGFRDGYAITGMGAAVFNGVLVLVAVSLLLYARTLKKSGVLR